MARNMICFEYSVGPPPFAEKRTRCIPLYYEKFDPFKKFPPLIIDRNKELIKFATEQGIKQEFVKDLAILKTIDNLVQDLSQDVRQNVQSDMDKAFASVSLPGSVKLAFGTKTKRPSDTEQPL